MNAAEIALYRPTLHNIAYRLVGCAAVAEDLVQDTLLNWLKVDNVKIADAKAYLSRSVTNACFNYISSMKRRKEEVLDMISPSVNFFRIQPDFQNLDIKSEVNQALALLIKKLPPAERAVFILKGLFDFDIPHT